jgi:hypothetical protein
MPVAKEEFEMVMSVFMRVLEIVRPEEPGPTASH